MTVCIGAVFERIGKIFFVTDAQLSADWISTEGVSKWKWLNKPGQWIAMYSAESASTFPSVVDRIRAELGNEACGVQKVMAACEHACEAEFEHAVSRDILLPYAFKSVVDFISGGLECLGASLFEQVCGEIRLAHQKFSFQFQLLVVGFDEEFKGHIFEVSGLGAAARYDEPGFHAIGSGAPVALATLYPIPYFCSETDETEIVYRLCAAKFAASSSQGVGPDTSVFCIEQGGGWSMMLKPDVATLHKIWTKEGQPRIPKRAIAHIQEAFLPMAKVEARFKKITEAG